MNRDKFQELRKVIAEKITIGGRHEEGQSDLFVHGDAEIRRNLIVRDDLTVLGKISSEGDQKMTALEVINDTVLKGDLSVGGITKLENVVLTSQVINTIVVREELSVGGSATLASCDNEINFLEFTKTRHLNDDEHTIVQNTDSIGEIRFKGSDGVNWIDAAKIYSNVDSTPGLNDVSSNINFATRSPGEATLQDRLTIISNGNIGISNTTPMVSLDLGVSDAIRIPCGSVAERPISTGSEHLGYIRYNTDLHQFEGFGAGNNWGSLGGVKDVDGDTYILAENSPGVDNDELNFYTNGNSNMIIKADGKIGLGVDLPAEKLDVNGNIVLGDKDNTDATIGNELHFKRTYKHHGDQTKCGLVSFDNGYANTANATIEGFVRSYGQKWPSVDNIWNYTPSIGFSTRHDTGPLTRRMIITEAGNVGIGTDDPESLLHLYESSNGNNSTILLERDCSNFEGSDDGCGIEFKLKYTGNNVSYRQTRIRGIDDGNGEGSGSGGIAFDTQYSPEDISSYIERMRISGSGNVGIGTNQPGERLDISGNIKLSGKTIHGSTYGDKILLLGDANKSKISHTGGYEYVNYHSGNINNGNQLKTGSHCWFSADGNSWIKRMSLTRDGNLGVGVENPVESLEVDGAVKAFGLILGNTSVIASATNLNYTSDVTSNIQAQLDSKSPNTGHSALSTVGTLTAGSIGGSFGEITTNHTVTGNSFVTGDISIGSSKIGYGTNSSLATLSNTGMSIDGNLGIGTTNPQSKLHIYDNIQGNHSAIVLERDCTNFQDSDDGCALEFKLKYTGNNVSYRQTRIRGIDDGNGEGSGSGGIAFDTQYYPTNTSNYLERMRIKGNGNIGIGTTNPSEKFTIEGGKLYIKNTGSNKSGIKLEAATPISNGDGGGKIFFEENSNGNGTYGFSLGYNGGDSNSILNWPANTFCISNHTNNTTGNISLAISRNTGNIGIGVNEPTEKLDVDGFIRAKAVMREHIIDFSSLPNDKYYPIIIDESSFKLLHEFYITTGGGSWYQDPNNQLIYGKAVGAGWSDSQAMVDITDITNMQGEKHILGIYRGTNSSFTGIAIYARGGTGSSATDSGKYKIYTSSDSVQGYSSSYTKHESTFAIKNNDFTDASGVSSQIDLVFDSNTKQNYKKLDYGPNTGLQLKDTILETGNTPGQLLINSGNLGIGTNDPQYKVDVAGSVRTATSGRTSGLIAKRSNVATVIGNDGGGGNTGLIQVWADASESGIAGAIPYSLHIQDSGGNLILGKWGDSTYQTQVDNRLVANNDVHITGSVGIGTTSPSEKLHVNGNIKAVDLTLSGNLIIEGAATTINSATLTIDDNNIELGSVTTPTDNTANGGGITLKGATDKTLKWLSTDGWSSNQDFNLSNSKKYKINGQDVLQLSSDNNNTILPKGYVGIGTSSPISRLHVSGSVRADYLIGELWKSEEIGTANDTSNVFNGFNIRFNRAFTNAIGASGSGGFADSIQMPPTWSDSSGGGRNMICLSKGNSIRMILKRANFNSPGTPYLTTNSGLNSQSWMEAVLKDSDGIINMNNKKITNVANPGGPQDVATKAYVDSVGGASGSGAGDWNNISDNYTTGSLGLGTTTPEHKLHITDSGNTAICIEAGTETSKSILYLGTTHNTTQGCFAKAAIIAAGRGTWSRSNMHFCLENTASNSSSENVDLSDSKMTILSENGNVGIGTTAPICKQSIKYTGTETYNYGLEIDNNSLSGDSSNRHNHILFTDGNSTQASIGGYRVGHNQHFGGGLSFMTGQNVPSSAFQGSPTSTTMATGALTERMRINSNGNVGIGTTAPISRLQVNGTTRTKDIIVTSFGTGSVAIEPEYLKPSSGAWSTSPALHIGKRNNHNEGGGEAAIELGVLNNGWGNHGGHLRYRLSTEGHQNNGLEFNIERVNCATGTYTGDPVNTKVMTIKQLSGIDVVGIGTTSPSEKLHVNGTIKSNKSIIEDASDPILELTNTTYTVSPLIDTKKGAIKLFNKDTNKYTEIAATVLAGQHTPSLITYTSREWIVPDFSGVDVDDSYIKTHSAGKRMVVKNDGNIILQGPDIITGTTLDGSGTRSYSVDVNSGTKVGIGTTAPTEKLHVSGGALRVSDTYSCTLSGANSTGPILSFDDITTSTQFMKIGAFSSHNNIDNDVNRDLHIRSGNAIRTTFKPNGDVGIGTTTPIQKLDFGNTGGNIRMGGIANHDSAATNSIGHMFSTNGQLYGGIQFISNGNDDELGFYAHQSGVSSGERMRIKGNGNIGIGTITPSQKLEVNGNIKAVDLTLSGNLIIEGTTTTINATTVTVDDKNIELGSVTTPTDTTANGGGITLKGATDKILIWEDWSDSWTSNQDFSLYPGKKYKINGQDVLKLSSDNNNTLLPKGNIGIGTTSPTEKLDLNGNICIGDSSNSDANVNNEIHFKRQYKHHGSETKCGQISFDNGSANSANATIEGFVRSAGQLHPTIDGTWNYTPAIGFNTRSSSSNTILERRMTLTEEGALGIGTDNPRSLLHIFDKREGNDTTLILERDCTNFEGSDDGCAIEFKLNYTGNNAAYRQSRIRGIDDGYGQGSGSGGIAFDTQYYPTNTSDYLERMRIKGNGNVGIGVIEPSEKLHVDGTIRTKDIVVTDHGTYNTNYTDTYPYYEPTNLKPGSGLWSTAPALHIGKRNQHLNGSQNATDHGGEAAIELGALNPQWGHHGGTLRYRLSTEGGPDDGLEFNIERVNCSTGTYTGDPVNTKVMTVKQLSGNDIISFNDNRIMNVANPTSAQDVATKAYVDSVGGGGGGGGGGGDWSNISDNYTTGKLGIGTTTPSEKLHIDGGNLTITPGSGNGGIQLIPSTPISNGHGGGRVFFKESSNYGFSLGYNGGDNNSILNWPANTFCIASHTNNATGDVRIAITRNDGNVGIGNSNPENNKLRITSTGYSNLTTDQHKTQLAIHASGYKSLGIGVMDDGTGTIQVKESGNGSGFSPLVLQGIAGNVGIGITNPLVKLTVTDAAITGPPITTGTATIYGASNISDYSIFNVAATNQSQFISTGYKEIRKAAVGNTVDDFIINNATNAGMIFKTNNIDRVKITNTGNVGIGTTSPTDVLHVVGNTKFEGNSNVNDVYIQNNNATNTSAPYRRIQMSGGNSAGFIYGAYNGTGAPGDGISIGYNAYFKDGGSWVKPAAAAASTRITCGYNSIGMYVGGSSGGPSDIGLFLNSAANVGIGTNSPQHKLHLKNIHTESPTNHVSELLLLESSYNPQDFGSVAHAGGVGIKFKIRDGNNQSLGAINYIGPNSDNNEKHGAFQFKVSNSSVVSEAMRIDYTGNVGIGTTSPICKQSIKYNGTETYNYGLEIDNNSLSGDSSNRHNHILFTDGSSTQASIGGYRVAHNLNYGGGLSFMTAQNVPPSAFQGSPTSTTMATGALTERMRINSIGNVGIGTQSPSEKLHVDGGNVSITSGSGNGGIQLIPSSPITNGDGGGRVFFKESSNYGFSLGYNGGDNNSILNWPANTFCIASHSGGAIGNVKIAITRNNGDVGIGTTSPDKKLHVHTGGIEIEENSGDLATGPIPELVLRQSKYSYNHTVNRGVGNIKFVNSSTGNNIYASQASIEGIVRHERKNGMHCPDLAFFVKSTYSSTPREAITIVGGENSGTNTEYGYVGIGTTSPTEKLDVNGNICIGDSSNSDGNVNNEIHFKRQYRHHGSETKCGQISFDNGYNNSANATIEGFIRSAGQQHPTIDGTWNYTPAIGFNTRSSSSNTILERRMTLTEEGALGIGTDNPRSLLHIFDKREGNDTTLILERDCTNFQGEDDGCGIEFKLKYTGNNVSYRQSRIRGIDDGTGEGSGSGGIAFDTQFYPLDTTDYVERMTISGDGTVNINGDLKYKGSKVSLDVFNWDFTGPKGIQWGQAENVENPAGTVINSVVGAVECALCHPTNAAIMYLGTINGGVWKTVNATSNNITWTPLLDEYESLSITWLSFDLTDTTYNTIYATIGRHSSYYRTGGILGGYYKTTTGGKSWKRYDIGAATGDSSTSGISLNSLPVSAIVAKGNTVVVSVEDSSFSGGNSAYQKGGIYRSTNGLGTGWAKISTISPTGNSCNALVVDKLNSDVLYCSSLGGGIYRSADLGATWSILHSSSMTGDGLHLHNQITTDAGRVRLATGGALNSSSYSTLWVLISEANGYGAHVYQCIPSATANQSTWKYLYSPVTADTGGEQSLTPTTTKSTTIGSPVFKSGGQGHVHTSLHCDTTNPNIVYVGGDRQPGGLPNSLGATNWTARLFMGNAALTVQTYAQWQAANDSTLTNSPWSSLTHVGTSNNSSPHADSRFMTQDKNGNLIETSDGGVYKRTLSGSSPNPTTQPNAIGGKWISLIGDLSCCEVHNLDYSPISKCWYGGTQDNGSVSQLTPTDITGNCINQGDGGDIMVINDISNSPSSSGKFTKESSSSSDPASYIYHSSQNLGGFTKRDYDSNNNFSNTIYPTGISNQIASKKFTTPLKNHKYDINRAVFVSDSHGIYETMNLQANNSATLSNSGMSTININMNAIEYGSNDDPDIILAGSGTKVYIRTGGNISSSSVPSISETSSQPSSSRYISGVAIHQYDSNKICACNGDYYNTPSSVNSNQDIFYSPNKGVNWYSIKGSLNLWNVQKCVFVPGGKSIYSNGPDLIVIADLLGVYALSLDTLDLTNISGSAKWIDIGNSTLPNARVYDMIYSHLDDVLIVSTMGRGVFKCVNFKEKFNNNSDAIVKTPYSITPDSYRDIVLDGSVRTATSGPTSGLIAKRGNVALVIGNDGGGGNTGLIQVWADASESGITGASPYILQIQDSGGNLVLGKWGDSTYQTQVDNRLVANNDVHITGSVGIGTTSPEQKLEVRGNILLGANDVDSFIHCGGNMTTTSDSSINFISDANDISGPAPGGDMTFGFGCDVNTDENRDFSYSQIGNSGRARNILLTLKSSNECVGIGTTSPICKQSIKYTGTETYNYGLEIDNQSLSGDASNRHNHILFTDGNSTQASIGGYREGHNQHFGGGLSFMTGKKSPSTAFQGSPTSTTMATGALTERMRINCDGYIGIGTISPQHKLHLKNSHTESPTNHVSEILLLESSYAQDFGSVAHAGGVGIKFKINDNNNGAEGAINYIGPNSDNNEKHGAFQFKVSNSSVVSEAMRIDYTGNVGIGTTSPAEKLDVNGNINVRLGGRVNIEPQNSILIDTKRLSDNWTPVQITQSYPGGYGGNLEFKTHNQGSIGDNNTPTTKMFIHSDGNVGIGTTSPDKKLHVKHGSIEIEENSGDLATGPIPELVLRQSKYSYDYTVNRGVGNIKFVNSSTGDNIYASHASIEGIVRHERKNGIHCPDLAFFVKSTYSSTPREAITIVGGAASGNIEYGNVGIGTTTPTEKLDVNGNICIGDSSNSDANVNNEIHFKRQYRHHGSETKCGQISFDNGYNNSANATIEGFIRSAGQQHPTIDGTWNYTPAIGFNTRSSSSNTILERRMTLTEEGALGIGTDNPRSLLHIFDKREGNDTTLILERDCTNFQGEDDGCALEFKLKYTGNNTSYRQSRIRGIDDGSGEGSGSGGIAFDTQFYPTNTSDYLERMRIKGNGNVGIGTTSPSCKLHVKGSGSTEPLALFNTTSGECSVRIEGVEAYLEIANMANSGNTTKSWGIGTNNDTKLHFCWKNNGTMNPGTNDALVIDTSGNVDINGTLTVDNLTVSGTTTTVNQTNLSVTNQSIIIGSGNTTDANANGGGITLKGTTDKTITWKSGNNAWTSNQDFSLDQGKKYKIDGDTVLQLSNDNNNTLLPKGNIGIGTTAPSEKLHVSGGALRVSGTYSCTLGEQGTGPILTFDDVATSTQYMKIGAYSSHNNIDNDVNRDLRIRSGNAIRTTFKPNGNVGIGTTSPEQKLEVHGNILLGANNVDSFIHGGANITTTSDGAMHFISDANDTSGAAPGGDMTFGFGCDVNTDTNRDFSYSQIGNSGRARNILLTLKSSNERVGIGTTSPSEKLHVDGGNVSITPGSGNGGIQLIPSSPIANGDGGGRVFFQESGNYGFSLGYNGGDNNSILNWPANTFCIASHSGSANGDVRIAITRNDGNVGIGNSNPENNKLRITSTGYSSITTDQHKTQLAIHASGYKSLGIGVMDDGTGTIQVKESGNGSGYSPLVLQGIDGNVGIGTTSPSSKLHIFDSDVGNSSTLILERNTTYFGNSDDGCAIEFKLNYTNNAAYIQSRIRGIDDLNGDSNGGGIAFDTQDSTATGYKERMRISHLGNVGIGTTSPTDVLHVVGNTKFEGNSNVNGVYIHNNNATNTSAPYRRIQMSGGNSAGFIYGAYNGTGAPGDGISIGYNAYFEDGGSWVKPAAAPSTRITCGYNSIGMYVGGNSGGPSDIGLFVNSAANVGIGTTSPSQKLDVSGNIAASGTVTQSDRRIKTDIEEVPDNLALSQVRDLECKYYHYKDPERRNETKTIGFIAQDVAAVIPNAVSKATKFIPDIMETPSSISWTEISEDKWNLKINLSKSISVGAKVKFMVNKTIESQGLEVISEVISLENSSFVFELNKKYDSIFAYGTEIDDFHYIDKSQIFALHHSAIQQLDKTIELEKNKVIQLETKLQEKDNEINTCKHENDELKRRLEIIEKHLNLN